MIAKIIEKSPAIYASVMVLTFAFSIFCIIGWLYGIFTAAKAGNFGLFVIDLLIIPVGVVHGWGAILGFW
jgi:hypothetical protein